MSIYLVRYVCLVLCVGLLLTPITSAQAAPVSKPSSSTKPPKEQKASQAAKATKKTQTQDRPALSPPTPKSFRWADAIVPRAKSWSRWQLQLAGGFHSVVQSQDAFSPTGIPMTLSPTLVVYDEVKRMVFTPFVFSFQLLENGRNDVYESFSYGFNISFLEIDLFLHPRIHLHYGIGLYQTGFRYHIGGAGLLFRAGLRVPIWSRSSDPRLYDRGFFHFILLPVSVAFLGRVDKPDKTGLDTLFPVLNGHGGLAFGLRVLPWLQVSADLQAHWNVTLDQSFLLQGEVAAQANLGQWFALRLSVESGIPLRPFNRRANLYEIYFMRFFSVGVNLGLIARFAPVQTGGKR